MLVLLVLLATAGPTVQSRIARGEAALDDLEYEQAADELMLAASDPRATPDQRLKANLLAGVANRIIGRDVEARLNFRHVLQRQPDLRLAEDMPPKVTSFFELVRQEVAAERAAKAPDPRASASPPGTNAAGDAAAQVDDVAPGPPVAGLAVLGVGGALLLGGAGAAIASEAVLSEPTLPPDEKEQWLLIGRVGLGAAAAGVVAAAVGGAGLAGGWFE
jgi:hypothetical protein